jgi:hypothetical protein
MIKKALTLLTSDAKKQIDTVLHDTEQRVVGCKNQIGSAYETAESFIQNKVDTGVATAGKVYATVAITFHVFKVAGITVGVIVAPVPTLIAASMLWLMASSVEEANGYIDCEVAKSKDNRMKDKAIKILKKYGQIPKTATVETELLNLNIDAEYGQVDGLIRKGEYQNCKLSDLSLDELDQLFESAPDDETKKLLEAYMSYRDRNIR